MPQQTLSLFLRLPVIVVAIWIGWGWSALAEELEQVGPEGLELELLSPDESVENVVDFYIDRRLEREGISPAAESNDANLVRRLALDLVGRIPTVAEVQQHIASEQSDKRAQLVDRLMNSPGFLRHQATELDRLLMSESGGSLQEYLTIAVRENRTWDQVFRDVVLAKGSDPVQHSAASFLLRRMDDLDRLTNDMSVLFFGVNISCAKCHDHPHVADWTQDYYYGMKSFFNRSFENGGFVAERDYGVVKYKNSDGDEQEAIPVFLTGQVIEDPQTKEPSDDEKQQQKKQLEQCKENQQPPPLPAYSRRAQLVEAALRQDASHYFSRAIINRLMYRFLGHGLVMPLDQMHSENQPSHLELLNWLARDLTTHAYDLRRLVRGLVLSRAYRRSSHWPQGPPPSPDLFAVAKLRPLTPKQMASSLRLATVNQNDFPPFDNAPDEFDQRIASLEESVKELAGMFAQPQEEFQIGTDEALLFSNSQQVTKQLFDDSAANLSTRLITLEDQRELVETAVWSIFSRPPGKEESSSLAEHLNQREDRPKDAVRQILWAMLTSAEFRFNY